MKGEVLLSINGAKEPATLLHEAKVVMGEALSFEKLYEKGEEGKEKFGFAARVIVASSGFHRYAGGIQPGKVDHSYRLFVRCYVADKTLDKMVNPEDFTLLTMFHQQKDKNDPIFRCFGQRIIRDT